MVRFSTSWSGPELVAVMPAAGVGTRMASALPKQYLRLAGHPVMYWSLRGVLSHPAVSMAVVAVGADDARWAEVLASMREALRREAGIDKPILTAIGGARRQDSVLAGLRALDALPAVVRRPDWVLVHDAVRPCLSRVELDRLIQVALADGVSGAVDGALLALPVRDTLKRASPVLVPGVVPSVGATIEREGLWQALTPQCFRCDPLRDALMAADAAGVTVTDEAQALERLGWAPRLVEGASTNLKLTWPADLPLLEALLRTAVDWRDKESDRG
jgi:2-C-methyl-D-erythritol 4-phosphate cytidylyltransferase